MNNSIIVRLRPLSALLTVVLFAVVTTPAIAQESDSAPELAKPGHTPSVYENPDLAKRYQSTITAENLAARLYFYSSDLFEGRETSTRGQKLAVQYLASQYRQMGLTPKGSTHPETSYDPSAYFQPFDVYGSRVESASLSLFKNDKPVTKTAFSAANTDDQAFLTFGSTPAVEAGVVFGGYGISDADLGYDDFAAMKEAGIDYTGNWLVFLVDEPLSSPDSSRFATEDGAPSAWTTSRFQKYQHLLRSGLPKGILVISDSTPRASGSFGDAAKKAAEGLKGVGSLSLDKDAGGGFNFPPVYFISSEFANTIFEGSGKTVASIQQQIDDTLTPDVFVVAGASISSEINKESYTAQTENVVAFIEGSDPVLKDEVVVVSAHLDHIGMFDAGDEDGINNGADDDGSGTVTVVEIARAFDKARDEGYGPRRSMLFLNVTGEEKGLLGSAWFADHEPLVPLENIVADLNIDMIGRIDPTHPGPDSDYVYIIGSKLISQELHDLNAKVNELSGINIDLNERFNSKDDPNRFYARSDHWNFGKHNIPFIFFFTGTHEDYHGVGDEADKIEYPRMERIAQMIFSTAWQVANQDERPAVSGKGFND